MKKYFVKFFVLLLFSTVSLFGQTTDWKSETSKLLSSSNYFEVIKKLNINSKLMPKDDEAVITLIICYSYFKLEDSKNQNIFETIFKEKFSEAKISLEFLDNNLVFEILSYHESILNKNSTKRSLSIKNNNEDNSNTDDIWQNKLQSLFQATDYSGIISLLNRVYPISNSNEKGMISIILSYCYSINNDSVNQKLWIKRKLEDYPNEVTSFDFLSNDIKSKILIYFEKWKTQYPIISNISLDIGYKKINYFTCPKEIKISIDINMKCTLEIFKSDFSSYVVKQLKVGSNTISIPINENFKKQEKHELKLITSNGSIKNGKRVEISIKYDFPQDIILDPSTDTIRIRGKETKNTVGKTIKFTSKTYFDKKHFFKKALPNFIFGSVSFLVNSQVINRVKGEIDDLRIATSLETSKKLFSTFSIGFSLRGLFKTITSFKKKIERKEVVVPIPEAVTWNKNLEKEIEKHKENIYLILSVRLR